MESVENLLYSLFVVVILNAAVEEKFAVRLKRGSYPYAHLLTRMVHPRIKTEHTILLPDYRRVYHFSTIHQHFILRRAGIVHTDTFIQARIFEYIRVFKSRLTSLYKR